MILWFYSFPTGANHAASLTDYPQEGNLFQIRNAFDNLSVPRGCLWLTTSHNRRWEIPAAWGNTGKPKGSTPPTTSTAGLGWLELREGAWTECTEPQCSADKDKFREWQPIKLAKQTNMKGRPATRSRAPEDKDPNPRLSCHHSTLCILKPQAVPQGSRAHSFPASSDKGSYRNIHWHHSHPSRRLLSN